ncbi:MAG: hypothetical protein E7545_04845 [Ruminococcaceae bacterium]|nr:hypothetical protein [Oscillospiraceae bacterium]
MSEKLKMLKPSALKGLLYNKKVIIPLSIFLAFVMWLVITTQENPMRERTFTNLTLNVNMENTFADENGMNIVSDISSQKFSVVVRGPSYVVSSLRPEDLTVYVSAATVDEPGQYKLDVVASRSSTNYEILSVSPSTVKVEFDYFDTKEFTVKADAKGAAATEGLIAEAGIVSGIEGDILKVTGPRSKVNKIAAAVAVCDVNRVLSETETFDAQINLLDEDGKVISLDNITLNAEEVKVKVPISKKKTVSVVADFTNLPGGFDKNTIKYTIDHAKVDIIGNPEAVDKISKITLSAIDVSSISLSNKKFDVTPKLPEGIRLMDNFETFEVTIDTSGYIEKTITVTTVKAVNLKSGLKSSQTSVRNVKICGPKAAVNKITAELLTAEVDLFDKAEGQHSLSVVMKFKNYKNVWVVGSYTTTATITKK